jgi:serine/threonine protein kinase
MTGRPVLGAALLIGQGTVITSAHVARQFEDELSRLDGLAAQLEATGTSAIHRDLSPANVFVGQRDHDVVYLSDFGIAKTDHIPLAAGNLLSPATFVAPEQAAHSVTTQQPPPALVVTSTAPHRGTLPVTALDLSKALSGEPAWAAQPWPQILINREAELRLFNAFISLLSEQQQHVFLFKINRRRAELRFALMLFQTALSHRVITSGLLLIFLAISRRYGHREEPDDHPLPARASVAAVRGELVLAS